MSKKFTKKLQKSISTMVMITTIVWMSGIAMIAPVFAYSNEATTSDITGTDPKIAANGESALAVLGINVVRVDNTDVMELNGVEVLLYSDDTLNEAAVANIETVDIYADSSLSGTPGVYDSADTLVRSVSRAESGRLSTTVSTVQASASTSLDLTSVTGLSADDTIKIGSGANAEIRQIATVVTNDTAAGDGCTAASGSNTCVVLSTATGSARTATTVVVEKADFQTDITEEGFAAWDSSNTWGVVVLGEAGDAENDANITWTPAKDDIGTNEGNDLFVRLTTEDGAANQTVRAKIRTGASGQGVHYVNTTQSNADVLVSSNTTNNYSKSVTFGSDGVAPTITKVETYDNNTNGKVDKVKVHFSESMADGVTGTNNFVNALGGDIKTIEAGATDINLEANASWETTTVLNDTLAIDFDDESYTSATNSTGDTWTVVYDQNKAAAYRFTDATGTLLADKSITTTDMARPYLLGNSTTTLHDLNGNGQIDELRVTFSESLGSSTSDGFTLTNSTLSTDYTLGAVNGYVTSSGGYSNSNDTIKIAITESGSSDLNDTYTLSYSAGSTVVDVAGNEATSRSGIAPTLSSNPVITKVEVKDTNGASPVEPNGKIDRIEITFSCNITQAGDAYKDFAVAGYAAPTAGALSGKVYTLTLTEGSVYDTDATPDVTYTNDGDGDYLHCGSASYPLENVAADTVIEADKAGPVLISQTLYETDSDDIWDSGETVQLFFSEAIDPSSIATSWSGDAFGDFADNLDAADRPDSGLMSINGKVVTLTSSEGATGALTTSDYIRPTTNEVKDAVGNSAVDNDTATFLVVTPTTAPAVDQINTLDENGNGIVDALAINFNGIVDGSTLVVSDFAAARGSNFSVDSTSEAATSTNAVSPDLTINEVVTQNGGNDSTVIVRFTEVGEDTGAHPQVKYVKGTLADLAANKVATLNAYSSDNTKFETTITTSTKDKVAPKVMEIRLKDRNSNNKCDQLMITYSEIIKNDAGALVNGVLSSTGWAIADHTIAASGNVYDNTNMALTYATTNAVFKVDINEISGNETAVPEVTFSGSGVTKDAWNNPLAAVAEGDITEVVECDITPELVDGDVARIGTAEEVYVIKLVGDLKFKRHIVSPMVFNSYGHLNWSMIQSVSSLDDYSLSAWVRDCTGPNETPAATDKVYEINADSTMHWLNMTAVQFYARGGSDEAIYNVNSGELGLYTLGVDVLYE